MIDAVVTHHRDSFRSGVGRFNELLGERLGVPVIGIRKLLTAGAKRPLLSFKVAELASAELAVLQRLVDDEPFEWELFLHVYDGHPLEEALVRGAAHVHAGNHEVQSQIAGLARSVDTLWSPGLILDERTFPTPEVTVFSFGMAHKIRTDLFERLRDLLEASGRSYAVYLSAANHETTKMQRRAPDLRRAARDLPVDALVPRQPLGRRGLQLPPVVHVLRDVLPRRRAREQRLRRGRDGEGGGRDHEPGRALAARVRPPRQPDRHRADDELPLDPERLEQISRRAQETARERGWTQLVDRLR